VQPIKNLEFPTVAAILAALLCLTIGQRAERFAASFSPATNPAIESAEAGATPRSGSAPVFGVIDYATTAALRGRTVAASPCPAAPAAR